ncbi:energy-coupling factor ABC transporter ATP-binding protein [Paenibacillus puerhi]|uniref:energy-coupling factor ABC transporter ATP-binding protein n=1 Tax=Paenibacillus puerhi TaxID=2692622 RepID=UPI00135958B4|nr:ATP-binding cassette domain-containing protein [Paenibacillus puerhi]
MIFSPSRFLSLRQAAVQYSTDSGTGRKALTDITLDIHQGEFVAVVGPNGSGKSTLASVLLGLCPLSRGSFTVQAGSGLRGVLQQPDTQVLGDTIEEEFALTLGKQLDSEEQLQAYCREALLQVGLRLSPGTPFSALSGGQRQLVNLALALSMQPDGLLLDEATAMLDPQIREQVLALVTKAHHEGMTVVWITHRMEEAAAAQRIVALKAGELAYDGPPEGFFYGDAEPLVPGAGAQEQGGRGSSSPPVPFTTAASPTPCERLALEPPFVVRTVKALHALGVPISGQPLDAKQLASLLRAIASAKGKEACPL